MKTNYNTQKMFTIFNIDIREIIRYSFFFDILNCLIMTNFFKMIPEIFFLTEFHHIFQEYMKH